MLPGCGVPVEGVTVPLGLISLSASASVAFKVVGVLDNGLIVSFKNKALLGCRCKISVLSFESETDDSIEEASRTAMAIPRKRNV